MRTVDPAQAEATGSHHSQPAQATHRGAAEQDPSSTTGAATEGAPDQASSGPAAALEASAERVIDEHTDLSTLTDQEIIRLTQNIKETSDAVKRVRPAH